MKVPLSPAFLKHPLAHRALHDVKNGRPENSRAAILAAIEAGYGIEIDVQRSADDRAMVFHDDDLDRLSEAAGPIAARSAAELGATRLRGGDEGIPSLPEVLELVAGRVPLLVEIKDQDGAMGPAVGPLETSVAQALLDYDGPVAVMSFNPHAVACMAERAPQMPRGLVTSAFDPEVWGLPEDVCGHLRDIPDYDRTGSSFISHEMRDLDRPRVAALKSAGAHVLCWTVRSPAQETQARKVAGNITFEGYRPALPA